MVFFLLMLPFCILPFGPSTTLFLFFSRSSPSFFFSFYSVKFFVFIFFLLFYIIALHISRSKFSLLSLCIKYCVVARSSSPPPPQPLFLLSKVYQIQEEVVLESLVGVIIQAAFNKFLCKHQIGEIHLVF